MGADTKTGVPFVVQTAPKHIYLQIADDVYSATEAFPDDAYDQVTWCTESVMETEVKYIRADLVAELIEAVRVLDDKSMQRTKLTASVYTSHVMRLRAALSKAAGEGV